jgi:hypothetical protein
MNIFGIISIAAAAGRFIFPTSTTDFQTVPSFRYTHGTDLGSGGFLGTVTGKTESGAIYGSTRSRQWIQHDESQYNQYDKPYPWQSSLSSGNIGQPSGTAKWIDYWASWSQTTWFCIVSFDYRLDKARSGLDVRGGTFPAGFLAQKDGLPWYHAGFVLQDAYDPNRYEWQTCAWITNGFDSSWPKGFWFDVPFFSELQESLGGGRSWYEAKLGGINNMYGFHRGENGGIFKRSVEDSTNDSNNNNNNNNNNNGLKLKAPKFPVIDTTKLTNKVVYGNASAIDLCTIPGAFGPSYVSLTEMKFCNLTSLELSDITVPLPRGKMVRSETHTIDFVIHPEGGNARFAADSGAGADAGSSQHKAVKMELGFKGIFDLATL